MLTYNRIAYEIDGVKFAPDDVEGLSMLMHYDYPEAWHLNGNATFSNGAKFGSACAYFPDTDSNITIANSTNMFDISPYGNYEFEAFIKLKGIDYEEQGYAFFGGHTFKYFDNTATWNNAKSACEGLGGHLATSTSAEKNTFLLEIADGVTIYLGATKETGDSTWFWLNDETWNYTNWADEYPTTLPEGMISDDNYLLLNSSGEWEDSPGLGRFHYICEWDYDLREGNILTVGDLTLAKKLTEIEVFDTTTEEASTVGITCLTWGINATASTILDYDTWYHLLLRISNEQGKLYIDGTEAISANIGGSTLRPSTITLGGYIGYLDEFVFRRNAGTGAQEIPTSAYGAEVITETVEVENLPNNAPVSRVAWSCQNLPEGLTLSRAGVLSGHPTTAGEYECDVSVSTNWNTTTKTIRIVVE